MENNVIRISEHAYMRIRERNGWNKKTADRMVARVYGTGKRMHQIKGYMKQWIKSLVSADKYGNDFVLYGQILYVFREKVLITVLNAPSKEHIAEFVY